MIRLTSMVDGLKVAVAPERIALVVDNGPSRRVFTDSGDRTHVDVIETLYQIERALELGYVPIPEDDARAESAADYVRRLQFRPTTAILARSAFEAGWNARDGVQR